MNQNLRKADVRIRWKRKWTAAALAAVITASAFGWSTAYADKYWDMEVMANSLEKQGRLAEAAPYWKNLLQHSADQGNWTNAALYAKALAKYYDSQHQNDEAIYYYELENAYWLEEGLDWGAEDSMRAEQLRTILDVYISTNDPVEAAQMAAPKTGGLAKFEPVSGMYIGLYPETDPKMGNNYTLSETFYNKKHAMYLAYTPWEDDTNRTARPGKFPARYAVNAKAVGAGLQIAWEPSYGLDKITDGPYLRQWARDAKASGIPIFLRFASEMNGDWVIWHGDPGKYIEKFRLVAQVMKEEAPNVAMVWSPGDVPKYSMDAYYPGDEYVDWVGVSLYTEPYENGNPSLPVLGTSPVERLDELYGLYADRKPIMISETAVSHYAHRSGESFTDWTIQNLDYLYSVMPKKYPRLKAITYFNSDMKSKDSSNDYLLRDNPAVMEAYKKLISGDTYLTKIEQNAKPVKAAGYRKTEGSASFAKQTKIVPFAKIPDVMLGRIEYWLNGTKLSTQTEPPYGLELNAGSVTDNSLLEVRVFNELGLLAASKSVSLSSRISISIDGKDLAMEQDPVIRNGFTLAPLRAIFEAMGAKVAWKGDTQTALGVKGQMDIRMRIGSPQAVRNGVSVMLEQTPELVNGYTMAPARFVGEAFGGKVSWDNPSRTVIITTK